MNHHTDLTVSESNAEKLNRLDEKVNRLLGLIEGAGVDAPGLMARLSLVEKVLFGKESQDGLVQKVSILYRIHVWILCTLSGLAGFALREAIRLLFKV